ncbi:MAG: hypothetical protein K6A41_04425 [Bacteroidales bacterium]|nr:hypothetical protein [Bacteroidales bacterium]
MKRRTLLSAVFAAFVVLLLGGCSQFGNMNDNPLPEGVEERSIYYWRTTFELNDNELDFLKDHQVKRMYVRLFDVDVNKDTLSSESCVPIGTIVFKSPIPEGIEIVPVVFITPEAILHYEEFIPFLCKRIHAMCKYNGLGDVREVQFDCDWTSSTREDYFQFLREVKEELSSYYSNVSISSTIRLHQLTQDPPDVAYGTLMCYNTGDFRDFNTKNAILDVEDVKPYLGYLKDYPLSLTLALPVFEWDVEFSVDEDFIALNEHQFNFSDTKKFQKTDRENLYKLMENGEVQKYVRNEVVSAKTILKTKKMVEKARKAKMPVTLYHLDSVQLSKYSDNEIEKMYR